MRLFKKVAVIGVGLIGGSIAAAIKKNNLAGTVVGTSRHKKNLLLAKRRRAIDKGSQDLSVIRGADLVIIAVPVGSVLRLAPQIAKLIGPECIVFDVASTKQAIVTKLSRVFPRYVGSHPMAGSEKRGITNSDPGMFKGSTCILTPTPKTDKKVLLKVRKLWVCLGAKVIVMPSASHDRALSFVSHLPHIAAFSLINSVPQQYFKFAASGLRDTTRIAASDSEIWSSIFLSNRKNLLFAVRSLEKNIAAIKKAIAAKDINNLNKILKSAKKKRDNL
ncbi:MAG: prephenate dehydrogenase/arogenate dehydrogenase family protein [Candidatus Omnitrophota bacterium]